MYCVPSAITVEIYVVVGARQRAMKQDEIRRRVQSALETGQYPPVLELPEQVRDLPVAKLFTMRVMMWVPESREANWRCPVGGCSCTPQIKGHKSREVDDVEHRTLLLFGKYQCRVSRKDFSTVSDSYMDTQSAEVVLRFPYVMTHKFGVSKKLMQVIHGGVTSRQGMKSALEGVITSRQSRFFHLRSLFGESVRQHRDANPNFIAPVPPHVDHYMAHHRLSDQDTLTQLWISWSEMYSALSEMVMNSIEVKKLVRVDHSRKFTSLLKHFGSKGKKEDIANFHLLLLVQNECGQIVARALTSSENSTETEAVLSEKVLPRIPDQPVDDYFLVSDNANALRGSVDRVFGGRVKTKQDPFHMIQRFTEKVRRGTERMRVAKELSAALYRSDRQLRDASAVGTALQSVTDSVRSKDLLCSREEWESTVASNLRQIGRGDVEVEQNFYIENGRSSKVVSTSQLVGIHSQLKRALTHPVSIGVGLRVLDIFILEHNLQTGARWGRNPPLARGNFLQLCQSALLCNGTVSESPLYAFALSVISKPVVEPRYRLMSAYEFPFRRWLGIFSEARPAPERIQLQAHSRPKCDIREQMFRAATRVKVKDISRSKLQQSLNVLDGQMEVSGPLSVAELELLRQIRREMCSFQPDGLKKLGSDLDWSSCPVATTVLYNLAVSANENADLSIARRSFTSLSKSIAVIDEVLQVETQTPKQKLQLFSFAVPRLVDRQHTTHEHAVQADLFDVLKATRAIKHRKRVFARLYTMAACLSDYLCAKSFNMLFTRWETLNTAARRHRQRLDANESILSVPTTNPEPVPSSDEAAMDLATPRDEAPATSTSPAASDVQLDPRAERTVMDPPISMATSRSQSFGLHPVISLPLPTELPPVLINHNDLVVLLNEASTIGRVPGKWNLIHRRFRELYPTSTLSVNALQCRLRALKLKQEHSTPSSLPLGQQPRSTTPQPTCTRVSSKRRLDDSACEPCVLRKKKCGREGAASCLKNVAMLKAKGGAMDHFLV